MHPDTFSALADVISEFPDLAKTCPFVFVPSTHDIGLSDVLPRAPLPAAVLERLLAKVPLAVLASNPCRCVPRKRRLHAHDATHIQRPVLIGLRDAGWRLGRIRFCTKEVVIFREDLVNKLRRNCVVPPTDPDLTLAQQV